MEGSREAIDFAVDEKFINSLSEPGESSIMKTERLYLFYPLYHLYLLYLIISQLINKDECPGTNELEKMGLNSTVRYHLFANFKREIFIYRFVHAIMLNRMDTVKHMLGNGSVSIHSRLDRTSLFNYAALSPSVTNFTYLSVAATLGRKEIFEYLIWEKTNPGKMIHIGVVKPVPIPLSVNECLLMNEIFHWYKSGKKKKLETNQLNKLIDAITLASRVYPPIVTDDHLNGVGIRVQWYWTRFRDIVKNKNALTRLHSLSPAIKELITV